MHVKRTLSRRTLGPLLGLAALAALGLAATRPAAAQTTINFGAAQTITGDTDVLNNGTTFLAEAFGNNSSPTVNGVTFATETNVNSLGNLAQSGLTSSAGFGSSNAPFSGLSANYQTLLGNGFFSNGSVPVTFTVSGLTLGHNYEAQFFVNDSRLQGISRAETITGGSTLNFNSTNADGGVGQYAVGLFSSGTSSQATFTVTGTPGTGTTQANAIQIRDLGPVPVPEPSVWAVLGLGGLLLGGLTVRARRRGA